MTQYTKLHEATGGKIQENKTQVFAWKWVLENREQIIRKKENNLIEHGRKVSQLNVEDCVRTFGVVMGPSMKWRD